MAEACCTRRYSADAAAAAAPVSVQVRGRERGAAHPVPRHLCHPAARGARPKRFRSVSAGTSVRLPSPLAAVPSMPHPCLFQFYRHVKNTSNTNVVCFSNRLWTLFEAGQPYRLDPYTLETVVRSAEGNVPLSCTYPPLQPLHT